MDIFSDGKVQVLLRSVERNIKMHIRVKGVFTIPLLEKLVKVVEPFQNDQIYKTVILPFWLFFA